MKIKCFVCLVGFLFASQVFAISVDRIVIVPRQPDLYVRSVNAVLNTKTQQTLVVFETGPFGGWPEYGQNHALWGQLLDSDGKPVGARFVIIPSSWNPTRASLTYDPDTNQFVLVFEKVKLEESREIYAVRLKATGRRRGSPVLVSPPHNSAFDIYNNRSLVFYDSENKANIIIWHRYVEGPPDPNDPKGVYAVLLNSNLSVRKKPTFIQTLESGPGETFGPHITSVAIHKPSGKLLLGELLYIPRTYESECLLAQVDRDLKTPATVSHVFQGIQKSECGVGLMQLPKGQTLSLFSQDDGVKKRKINSDGVPSGSITKFFAEPLRNQPIGISGPALSSSNTSKEFAVLAVNGSEIETAEFWLQRTNAKGKASGPSVVIESGVDNVKGGTVVALPAPPKGGHLFAVLYIEGERDQPPLNNQGSGLVLLRVNTP